MHQVELFAFWQQDKSRARQEQLSSVGHQLCGKSHSIRQQHDTEHAADQTLAHT